MTKTINIKDIPHMKIVVNLDCDDTTGFPTGFGTIETALHTDTLNEEDVEYNACIDGIESMILACACAGFDIESPAFLEAIETAVEKAANTF